MTTELKREDITFDPNADYLNDPKGLALILIQEVHSFRQELDSGMYDINDPFTDYMEGLISAREVVLGRMGVASELYSNGDC
jgi:hypothetical protein